MAAQDSTIKTHKAYFAGGCFWCMEPAFEKLPGVIEVKSGYANGDGTKPTYKDYAQHGYVEAINISYDPQKIDYNKLLETLWHNIDPTDSRGQFVDKGPQYRSAIFYTTDQEKESAQKSKEQLQKSGRFSNPIVTEISKLVNFFDAEEYHQDYYKKNPLRYKFYRYNSGRDNFLDKTWKNQKPNQQQSGEFKKPSSQELLKRLTPLQYDVTQKKGTESAFKNAYWNNKEPGIYVDIVSGEPLFSSLDKYDAGTGWPSFTKPLEPSNIITKEDTGWFSTRTEVRSKLGDSHLGHVFNDGPPPTGLRYCMNSAALSFIPLAQLEENGYGIYKKLFDKK